MSDFHVYERGNIPDTHCWALNQLWNIFKGLNMRKVTAAFILTLVSAGAYADEVACIPRSEMGETITGENIYERDADLKISNLSRIDFESLTITSAEGKSSKISAVGDNVYQSIDPGARFKFYYITNATRSIVTELSISESATYVKVLLCKRS